MPFCSLENFTYLIASSCHTLWSTPTNVWRAFTTLLAILMRPIIPWILPFAHHLVFPGDTLVIVPSILDLFNWDRQVGRYLPYFSSVDVAVASFAQALHDILVNLMAVPIPCSVVFTDLVGLDCLTWAPIAGDIILQRWIDAIVPRVNSEVAQANFWNGVPVVPFGWRIHGHRPTVDGVLSVNDYRAMPDGFMPNRRQQRRWARVLINLLKQYN